MEEDGSFFLKNLGKSSIFLNGKEVARGQLLSLNSGSLIEVNGFPSLILCLLISHVVLCCHLNSSVFSMLLINVLWILSLWVSPTLNCICCWIYFVDMLILD